MLIYLAFFLSSFTLGLSILEVLKIYPSTLLKIAGAFTIGTTANLLALFLIASIFGLNFITSFISTILIFLTTLVFLKKVAVPEDFGKINLTNLRVLLPFLPITVIIFAIFYKSIFILEDSIIAGNRLVWVDWPVHISLISSFVYGDNFPPQNPMHPSGITTYPFFIEFLSAILQSLGATLKNSLVAPGFILGITIIALLYNFGRQFFGKSTIAILAIYIGLIWGGLGFLYFFRDLFTSGDFVGTILFPPKEYTFLNEKNLWFFTFLYSELLPQRAFLLGLPIFLTSITFLISGITTSHKAKTMIAGYLIGILPFVHMHSYISAIIMSFSFLILTLIDIFRVDTKRAKNLIFQISIHFFLPILGLGLIQLPVFLNVAGNAFAKHLGFLQQEDNFLVFWFKNIGFFWPLWIAGFFIIKDKVARYILLASLPLFILPNLFRFAPWPYDNLKIFTYWYLIGSFAVATALVKLWSKNFAGKIITIILFVSLTLSGFLEMTRIINTNKTKIQLWNNDDIELSKVIMEKTQPQSTILTAAVHDHPVTSLSGRKIVIGFPGNAWSWGYSDWQQREQDVRKMFQGNPSITPALLNKYDVNYILISQRERNFEPLLDENYFQQNYETVAVGPDFRIFKVE